MKTQLPMALVWALFCGAVCPLGCVEDIQSHSHSLDSGKGDPNQWVPTGAAMQQATPRAAQVLGAQCTLMRFDWFYLEDDLKALSQIEIERLQEAVQPRFGCLECGRLRAVYGVLATAPAGDRGPLIERAAAWEAPRAGHTLRPEILSQFEAKSRLSVVEVAGFCPDLEACLPAGKALLSIAPRQWAVILDALRSSQAAHTLTGAPLLRCGQAFALPVPVFFPALPGSPGRSPLPPRN